MTITSSCPRLLDCTLRDGGYANDHSFSTEQALQMIRHLLKTGVDAVEIGYYRRDKTEKELRTVALCPDRFLADLPDPGNALLGVMLRPGATRINDLTLLAHSAVRLVRIPTQASNLKQAIDLAIAARDLGMFVCMNAIRISELDIASMRSLLQEIFVAKPNAIYLADSNGALLPEQVASLVSAAKEIVSTDIGFHAHDGLQCAVANSWTAIRAGAMWVDGSIAGLGKGGGNAPLEALLALFNRQYGRRISLTNMLHAADLCASSLFQRPVDIRIRNTAFSIMNYNLEQIMECNTSNRNNCSDIDYLIQNLNNPTEAHSHQ